MRRTFMDDQFDEWEAYVSGGQLGGKAPARVMFVCISRPNREPRYVIHKSGDPADAEHDLFHMSEEELVGLFDHSDPML